MVDEKTKALQELLKIIVEHPEIVDRMTLTIKPSKLIQGKKTKSK